MGTQMAEFMREVFRADLSSRLNLGGEQVVRGFFIKSLKIMIAVCLPIGLAGFVMGVFGSLIQIGSLFTLEPLQPDFAKISPLQGLKRMFSMKHVLEGLKLVFKMTVLLAVLVTLIKGEILKSPVYLGTETASMLGVYGHAVKVIFLSCIGVMAVFAGIDFGIQRWDWGKQTKMTKQEAKQEHKEREGDPHIKARIRMVQREMARKRMMQAVKKADVVITNPTHFAVAIVYEKDKMAAPRVVAKGADLIAKKIKKIAAEAGVPLVENVPLARTLFKNVKVGQSVPRVLYQAVAEVLAYVYRLKNRGF
jgi:flagellar biosynthetic protein FlhB